MLIVLHPGLFSKPACFPGRGGRETRSRGTGRQSSVSQEAKYVERWPNTTCAWAGWSRFDIPVDRYGGVHSQLICTSIKLVSPTCHQASQQENTY
jgi:hypothetical protein